MRRSWVIAVVRGGASGPGERVGGGGPGPARAERRRREHLDRTVNYVDGRRRPRHAASSARSGERRQSVERTRLVARALRHSRRRLRRLDHGALRRRAARSCSPSDRRAPITRAPGCSCWTRGPSACASASRLPEFVSVDAISPDGRDALRAALSEDAGRALVYDVMALDLRDRPVPRRPDHGPARAGRADGRHPAAADDEPRRALGLHALQRRGELRPRAGHAKGEARCIDLPAGDLSAQRARRSTASTLQRRRPGDDRSAHVRRP